VDSSATDTEAAIGAARAAFAQWRRVAPRDRARILREIAAILRHHADEFAFLDALNCGNPLTEMLGDVERAAVMLEFFAGLVTEIKGDSIPTDADTVNFSVREPRGVVARIIPFNHPLMFCAGKSAAPLAAGNTVVIKPSEQAPLSAFRFAELIDGLMPPGVWNLVPGGPEAGAALSAHPDVAIVSVVGSVPTGRAVMRAAAATLKPSLLELGGKNALIAFPDASPNAVARAAVSGMNFTWCGQSCGSTSRAFVHADIYNDVLESMAKETERLRPGVPTDRRTTMGAIVSSRQFERVKAFIESAQAQGARLVVGGHPPRDPSLSRGYFLEPTIFADITRAMTIAREEIFGPVLAVMRWDNEAAMIEEVNAVEYGLTCSIWTRDLALAHRTAQAVEAGYVWINETSRHLLGTPFGGYKQSGIGREECLEELLAFTQEKHIHVNLAAEV
jgi:betaine-aldehyde dehydrogenase